MLGKKTEEIDKNKLMKEREDIIALMQSLEEDFRKSNISEKYYKELKEKYSQKLSEINKKLGIKEEKTEKKKGILGKLFGKKKEEEEAPTQAYSGGEDKGPEFVDPLKPPPEAEEAEEETETPTEGVSGISSVELEKIKIMIDALREDKKAIVEQIQALSENIGEVRASAFQTDASVKELEVKFEKLNEEVKDIEPIKIRRKLEEFEQRIEKINLFIEKAERKFEDLSQKINKAYEILKSIGSIENISNIVKDMNQKVEDVKEAIRYIERIGAKTEKAFIDMTKNLEDFVVYKAKQEALDEAVKDILKTLESINVKIENLATKKELNSFKGDLVVLQKKFGEIEKIIPIVKMKLPETITHLRDERNDIMTLLASLDEQLKSGAITKEYYEEIKKKNLERLEEINNQLIEEWKKIEKFIEESGVEKPPEETSQKKPMKEEVKEEEEKMLEKKEVKEVEEEEKEVSEEKSEEKKGIKRPKFLGKKTKEEEVEKEKTEESTEMEKETKTEKTKEAKTTTEKEEIEEEKPQQQEVAKKEAEAPAQTTEPKQESETTASQSGKEPIVVVSKKTGKKYYLHVKKQGSSNLYYFSKNPEGAISELPEGYEIVENEKTGLIYLKRIGSKKEEKKEVSEEKETEKPKASEEPQTQEQENVSEEKRKYYEEKLKELESEHKEETSE